MAGNVLEFTTQNFPKEVLESSQVVMVDFWAPWCGPCRMLAPTIDELANQYAGKIRVGKLNTDDHPDIASEYGISGIPTVLVFKGGQIVDKLIGMQQKAKLEASITSHM
jgi:thioredoxin 1